MDLSELFDVEAEQSFEEEEEEEEGDFEDDLEGAYIARRGAPDLLSLYHPRFHR